MGSLVRSPRFGSCSPARSSDEAERASSQPQLALRLETTFAASASSSSHGSSLVPLRMVLSVTFDPLFRDSNRGGNQQPLLLDSLDLTSFSSPEIRAATPTDQLPLKAVYRDAVLGLRYLALSTSARSAPNVPQVEFRRIQAKFASTAERERFVEAIKALVPAKPAVEAESAAAAEPTSGAVEPPAKKKAKVTPSKPAATKPPTPRPRKKQTVKKVQRAGPVGGQPQQQPELAYSNSPTAAPASHLQPQPFTPVARLPRSQRYPPQSAQPFHSSTAPRLPTHLSTLLPHLATASTSTASQLVAALPQGEFEQLLQDALLEEGFEQLVERVQETLLGGGRPAAG